MADGKQIHELNALARDLISTDSFVIDTGAITAKVSLEGAKSAIAGDAESAAAAAQATADAAQTAANNAVKYSAAQTLTEAQMQQARQNIGVDSAVIVESVTNPAPIMTIDDGAAANARDFVIGIEPVQAGSGYPSPTNVRPISGWTGANVTRTGFNVWDEEWRLGYYASADGNFRGNTSGYLSNKNSIKVIPNTTYYFNTNGYRCEVFEYDFSGVYLRRLSGDINNGEFTTSGDAYYINIDTYNNDYGTTYNNDISVNYPSTDTSYHAYTGTTYPISWQSEAGTVYGGTLDVTTGLLTVTMAEVDLGTLVWLKDDLSGKGQFMSTSQVVYAIKYNQTAISSKYSWLADIHYLHDIEDKCVAITNSVEYPILRVRDDAYISSDAATFKAAMSGVQLVYELATPQTYQLSPAAVPILLGQNNVWADCGDVQSLEYVADTKLYIQKINTPTDDDMTADAQIASGKYFIIGNNLYLSTTTIPAGDTINPGTNCTLTNLADALNALNS